MNNLSNPNNFNNLVLVVITIVYFFQVRRGERE